MVRNGLRRKRRGEGERTAALGLKNKEVSPLLFDGDRLVSGFHFISFEFPWFGVLSVVSHFGGVEPEGELKDPSVGGDGNAASTP